MAWLAVAAAVTAYALGQDASNKAKAAIRRQEQRDEKLRQDMEKRQKLEKEAMKETQKISEALLAQQKNQEAFRAMATQRNLSEETRNQTIQSSINQAFQRGK